MSDVTKARRSQDANDIEANEMLLQTIARNQAIAKRVAAEKENKQKRRIAFGHENDAPRFF